MAEVNDYDFDKQNRQGKKGETFLDEFFSQWYAIVPATDSEQRQGIDRWFKPRPFGKRFPVEYKTDTTAARTHNAFVETVSVDTANKPGWAYTSQAKFLIYYIPGDELIYVIPFAALRGQLPHWSRRYPLRRIPNRGYHTHGLLVELVEFERCAKRVFSV